MRTALLALAMNQLIQYFGYKRDDCVEYSDKRFLKWLTGKTDLSDLMIQMSILL